MVLRENDGDSFPGADFLAQSPLTAGECCSSGQIAELAAAASAAGVPYTIKGATLFLDGNQAAIDALCVLGDPAITSVVPSAIPDTAPFTIFGSNFGPAAGNVWLTDTANFVTAPNRAEQTPDAWADDEVHIAALNGAGLPIAPEFVWCWVINRCGGRNVVGEMVQIIVI